MTKNKGQNSWKSRPRHHDSWCQCLSKYHVTHNVILIKWCKNVFFCKICKITCTPQNHCLNFWHLHHQSWCWSEYLPSTPSLMVSIRIFGIDTMSHGVGLNYWHQHHESWCRSEFLASTPWVMLSVWIFGIDTMIHGVGLNFWQWHYKSWGQSELLSLTPSVMVSDQWGILK